MADDKQQKAGTVKVVLRVPTNRANRGDVIEVDKKTADRLIANQQASKA